MLMYGLQSMESICCVVTGKGGFSLTINLGLFCHFNTFSALWSMPVLTGNLSNTYCSPCLCEGAQASYSVGCSRLKCYIFVNFSSIAMVLTALLGKIFFPISNLNLLWSYFVILLCTHSRTSLSLQCKAMAVATTSPHTTSGRTELEVRLVRV